MATQLGRSAERRAARRDATQGPTHLFVVVLMAFVVSMMDDSTEILHGAWQEYVTAHYNARFASTYRRLMVRFDLSRERERERDSIKNVGRVLLTCSLSPAAIEARPAAQVQT